MFLTYSIIFSENGSPDGKSIEINSGIFLKYFNRLVLLEGKPYVDTIKRLIHLKRLT